EPIEFAPRENPLQLSPYLLGLLLGDGSLRGESVSFDWTEAELSPQLASQPSRSDDVSVDGLRMRPSASTNPIRRSQTPLALEHYGLYGLSSLEKFIPDDYLFGTVQERLDLLRGLFDTDGHVIVPGGRTVEFTTSSPRLADGVIWLVRSLGGIVSYREKLPQYEYLGERRKGTPATRIRASFPNGT